MSPKRSSIRKPNDERSGRREAPTTDVGDVSPDPRPARRRDPRRVKAAFGRTAAASALANASSHGAAHSRRRQRIADVVQYAYAPSVTRVTRAPRQPVGGTDVVAAALRVRPDLASRLGRLARRAERGDAYAARILLDEARLVVETPAISIAALDAEGCPAWIAEAHRIVELLQRAYEVRMRQPAATRRPQPARRASPSDAPDLEATPADRTVVTTIGAALARARRAGATIDAEARDVARSMMARAYLERGTCADSARGAARKLAAELLGISRTKLYTRLKGYDQALAVAATIFAR